MSRTEWAPILMYHQVVRRTPERDPYRNYLRADIFDAQLAWLRARGYRSTSIARLRVGLEPGETLPHRSVVISFDDGYRSNLEVAWPILRRHGFTATVFVVSGTVGGYNDFDREAGLPREPMLSAGELRQLHSHGFEIGSHTVTHPASLRELPDRLLEEELTRSRRDLEALLDVPVTTFSYPHSQVDGRVEAAVEAAGYSAACAGVGTAFTPLRLGRVDPRSRTGVRLEATLRWRQVKWLGRSIAA